MRNYSTIQGDTWDLIAYQQMGSCNYAHELMLANREYLDYYSFPAGITLQIPDIVPVSTTELPPWKVTS